jgi:hypothetical protein
METPVPRPSSPPALLNDPEEHRLFLKTMKTFANMKETFDRGRRATEHSFMVQNMTVKDGGACAMATARCIPEMPATCACSGEDRASGSMRAPTVRGR